MSDQTLFKGLDNPNGANNCFLNVVIQSLWHLNSFRNLFLNLTEHHHQGENCVICALEVIFVNYKFSNTKSTTPQILREGLSKLYASSQKFQMNAFDDAAEVFVAILENIHKNLTNQNDTECPQGCLVHNVFGLNILQQRNCTCGEALEPESSSSFLYYSFAKELIEFHQKSPKLPFEQLLKTIKRNDFRKCPSERCNGTASASEWLLSAPSIFTIGIAWDSASAHPENEIAPILELIDKSFDLTQTMATQNSHDHHFRFRGMICYYGFHYVSIFHVGSEFIFCDDTLISRSMGSSFAGVKDKCVRGHLQPTLIFYEHLGDDDDDPETKHMKKPSNSPTTSQVSAPLQFVAPPSQLSQRICLSNRGSSDPYPDTLKQGINQNALSVVYGVTPCDPLDNPPKLDSSLDETECPQQFKTLYQPPEWELPTIDQNKNNQPKAYDSNESPKSKFDPTDYEDPTNNHPNDNSFGDFGAHNGAIRIPIQVENSQPVDHLTNQSRPIDRLTNQSHPIDRQTNQSHPIDRQTHSQDKIPNYFGYFSNDSSNPKIKSNEFQARCAFFD